MGFFSKLFRRNGGEEKQKVGGMEDFMTLIRVYFQAALASDLGITNLGALPDLRVFKATLKVPTVNNKLGVGERSRCKKMLKEMYVICPMISSRRWTAVSRNVVTSCRMPRLISSSSRGSRRT